jgi:hypothetical protein
MMIGPLNFHPVSAAHLPIVMGELVRQAIRFQYEPMAQQGWHRIAVERENWPLLESIANRVAMRRIH